MKYSSADRRPTPPLNSSDDCKQLDTASRSDALQHLTSGKSNFHKQPWKWRGRKNRKEKTLKAKPTGRSAGGDRPIVSRLYFGFYYFLFHPFLPSIFPLLPHPASVCCSVVPSVSFDALILSHCDFICSSFLLIVLTDSRVCARGNGSLSRAAVMPHRRTSSSRRLHRTRSEVRP